ncbi:unnamed protein product [Amoebophrya sp. A120]|nr:unnamed protein product [Amoebophrya sp. A120]|eukprot:GSA120T00012630001.1
MVDHASYSMRGNNSPQMAPQPSSKGSGKSGGQPGSSRRRNSRQQMLNAAGEPALDDREFEEYSKLASEGMLESQYLSVSLPPNSPTYGGTQLQSNDPAIPPESLYVPPVPERDYQMLTTMSDRFKYNFKTRWVWFVLAAVVFILGVVTQSYPFFLSGYNVYFWADASRGAMLIVLPLCWFLILGFIRPFAGYTDRELIMRGYDITSAEGKRDLAKYRKVDLVQTPIRTSAAEQQQAFYYQSRATVPRLDEDEDLLRKEKLYKKDLLARDRSCCCRLCCPVCSFLDCCVSCPKFTVFVYTALTVFFMIWSLSANIAWASGGHRADGAQGGLKDLLNSTASPMAVTWFANMQMDGSAEGRWYSNDEVAGKPYDPAAVQQDPSKPAWLSQADPTASYNYANYTAGELIEIHRRNNWVPRKIWLYWNQGWDKLNETQYFIRLCVAKLEHLHPEVKGWKVNKIDAAWMAANFSPDEYGVAMRPATEYQQLPPTPPCEETDVDAPGKPNYSNQHKGDRARVAVLQRYGGVYLDVTTILNNDLKEYEVENLAPSRLPLSIHDGGKLDYQGSGQTHITMHHIIENADRGLRPFVSQPENWFIAAPPQSYYLTLWHSELYYAFWKPLPDGTKDLDLMHARYMNRVRERHCENTALNAVHPEEYLKAYYASYLLFCVNGPENNKRQLNFQYTLHRANMMIYWFVGVTTGWVLYDDQSFYWLSALVNYIMPALGGFFEYPNPWAWFYLNTQYEQPRTFDLVKITGKHPKTGQSFSGCINERLADGNFNGLLYRQLIRPLKRGHKYVTSQAEIDAMQARKDLAIQVEQMFKNPEPNCGGGSCE